MVGWHNIYRHLQETSLTKFNKDHKTGYVKNLASYHFVNFKSESGNVCCPTVFINEWCALKATGNLFYINKLNV